MPDRMGKKKKTLFAGATGDPKGEFHNIFSFSNQSFNISVCISFSGTNVVILFSIRPMLSSFDVLFFLSFFLFFFDNNEFY